MKAVEKFFLRLNNREQTLLVITLWTVLLIGLIQTLKFASILYQDWKFADQTMSGHQTIISLKPMIDSALEKQKTEQKNKSYDKNQLSNKDCFIVGKNAALLHAASKKLKLYRKNSLSINSWGSILNKIE